jgi:hypothetical protein
MPLDGVTTAAIYECKFAIDSDGSSDASDPDHQQKTSLRHTDNTSLDAREDVFGVIPLNADEARREGLTKLPGVPDFGGIALRLGDIGVAFWKDKMTAFVYGDKGPPNALGEGSIAMAEALGIPANPSTGGFNDKDVHDMNKGVMHIVFPGSSDVPAGSIKTARTGEEVQELGEKLFKAFCRQRA